MKMAKTDKIDKNGSVIICMKIERTQIAPYKNKKCHLCGELVGITKSSYEIFQKSKKPLQYVCMGCSKDIPFDDDDKIVPLSKDQQKELLGSFFNS